MRFLIRARVKTGREQSLLRAIESGTLGTGCVAEGEYLRNMNEAHILDGRVRWIEICYCPLSLQEERPYWEEYFELTRIQDAHDRRKCRDANRTEPWACGDCDCTKQLERKLAMSGECFMDQLRKASDCGSADKD